MTYALILSGGSGTRFWPLSRRSLPKQFLNIYSDKPMIVETIMRIRPLIRKENILIAANKAHAVQLKKCALRTGVPVRNIFLEPESRNTFPPIAVLAKRIYEKDKDAVIAVLPSDHFIKNDARFLQALKKAAAVANKGYIVTLGVPPSRPETGYGYIEAKAKKDGFFTIGRFIEKPDLAKARQFVKNKRFYWNGGFFIFRADVMLNEIRKLAPKDFRAISKIKRNSDAERLWKQLTALSVDYAIMEKTRKTALVPADFGWTDLGSWEAVEEFSPKDKSGNVLRGQCVDLGSKDIFVLSGKRLVATVGLDNIIVVDTPDAVLVCSGKKSQDVKKLVELLKRKHFKKLL